RSALTCLSINLGLRGPQTKHPALEECRVRNPRAVGIEVLRERKIARRLLAALGHDLERDLLAFRQRAQSGALDRADVHEHILRAVGRLDESKTLLRIEELHGTCRHHGSPSVATPVN